MEIRKYLKVHQNENKTYQNLGNAAKAVLRGKYLAINADIEKQRYRYNLRYQKKKNKLNPKLKERRKKILEINEIENRKTIEKINVNKSWFFAKIDGIEKTLARWTKKKRLKLLKSEMKVGTLLLIVQKQKGL